MIWGNKGKNKDQKFPSHFFNKMASLGSNIYGWIYLMCFLLLYGMSHKVICSEGNQL